MRHILTAALLFVSGAAQAQSSRDTAHVKAQRIRLDSTVVVMDALERWCRATYTTPKYLRAVCPAAKLRPDRRARVFEDSLLLPPPVPPIPVNQRPHAAFTVSWAGTTATLDASTSTDDKGVLSYQWSAPPRPPKTGVIITRGFSATDTAYKETLIVTDSAGLADTTTRQILGPPTTPPVDTTTPTPPPAGSPAELPRVWLNFPYPTPVTTITVPAGGNLQAALSTARGQHVEIVLEVGATWTGNFTASSCGAGWITVRSAGTIPTGRMRPSLAPTLAKVQSGNTLPAITVSASACRWWFSGFEVVIAPSVTAATTTLVNLEGSEIVLDRMLVRAQPTTQIQRCITLNSKSTQISDSWIAECHAKGFDSQAILGYNGPGPYRITNNYLEGAGENVMFGGADPSVAGLVPSDIELRGNHIFTPTAWRGTGPPNTPWTKKNLLEIKNGARVLVEANVMDGSWLDGQTGWAIILKSENQSGNCRWCRTTDVTIRRNLIRNVGAGIGVGPKGDNPATDTTARRIYEPENVIEVNQAGDKRGFSVFGGVADVSLERNVLSGSLQAALILDQQFGGALRTVYKDNVWASGTSGAVIATGAGGLAALQQAAPGFVWTGMQLVGSANGVAYPPGTTWLTSESSSLLAQTVRATVAAATAGVVVPP